MGRGGPIAEEQTHLPNNRMWANQRVCGSLCEYREGSSFPRNPGKCDPSLRKELHGRDSVTSCCLLKYDSIPHPSEHRQVRISVSPVVGIPLPGKCYYLKRWLPPPTDPTPFPSIPPQSINFKVPFWFPWRSTVLGCEEHLKPINSERFLRGCQKGGGSTPSWPS